MNNEIKINILPNIGLFGVLGIVFITLKLCGVIGWSWWCVLIPFYPMVICYIVVLVCLVLIGILTFIYHRIK